MAVAAGAIKSTTGNSYTSTFIGYGAIKAALTNTG